MEWMGQATDNCPAGLVIKCQPYDIGETLDVGEYTITCHAEDADGNESASCTFTLHVEDNEAPEVTTCTQDVYLFLEDWEDEIAASWPMPEGMDNCSPVLMVTCDPPLENTMFGVGVHPIDCTITDESGNEAHCQFNEVVVKIHPVESVEFIGSYELLDNNSDWEDAGNVYEAPHWVEDGSHASYPVVYPKGSWVTVTVSVKVEPADVEFDLTGTSAFGFLNFSSTGNISTGDYQEITVTSDSEIFDWVNITTGNIDWSIDAKGRTFGAGTSGEHKIYVTYGAPVGTAITEKRINDVCTSCSSLSSLSACANSLSGHLSGYTYDTDPNAPPNGPDPIWRIHQTGGSSGSQCPGLALFINAHFQMLGLGSGSITYCRAFADGHYYAFNEGFKVDRPITGGQYSHPDPTPHATVAGYERLYHIDGSGYPNNYEATCLFNGKHYAVGVGVFDTPKEVVVNSFGVIDWYFFTGPAYNNILRCGTSPWIEAPPP